MSLNVSELIDSVRDQLDEANTANVTDAQILKVLNRGQRKATNIIARKYDDLFVVPDSTTSTTAGTIEYDIPAKAMGRRIEKVELTTGDTTAWEIRRISFHDITRYESVSNVTRPYYYALRKNKLMIYPKPSGGLTIRIWYSQKPEDLVIPQGRITAITDSTTDIVTIDAVGADLTTDTSDGFDAYVNFIDYVTGEVKGTMQVSNVDSTNKQITLKSSGLTRSTVLGRTVATTIDTDVAVDDYVCIVTGTCVPEIPGAYTDYLTQFAVTDIKRRLGEDTAEEFAQLKELEEEIVRMWAGREASHRIRKSSTHWSRGLGGSLRRLLQ
jgi:hypothetical protein